jgi:hypothetical protein
MADDIFDRVNRDQVARDEASAEPREWTSGVENYWCGCVRKAQWSRCCAHVELDHDDEPPPQVARDEHALKVQVDLLNLDLVRDAITLLADALPYVPADAPLRDRIAEALVVADERAIAQEREMARLREAARA